MRNIGIGAGVNRLFVNGLEVALDEPNLFEILALLKDDAAVIDQLAHLGVPPILIPGFLSARLAQRHFLLHALHHGCFQHTGRGID